MLAELAALRHGTHVRNGPLDTAITFSILRDLRTAQSGRSAARRFSQNAEIINDSRRSQAGSGGPGGGASDRPQRHRAALAAVRAWTAGGAVGTCAGQAE